MLLFFFVVLIANICIYLSLARSTSSACRAGKEHPEQIRRATDKVHKGLQGTRAIVEKRLLLGQVPQRNKTRRLHCNKLSLQMSRPVPCSLRIYQQYLV